MDTFLEFIKNKFITLCEEKDNFSNVWEKYEDEIEEEIEKLIDEKDESEIEEKEENEESEEKEIWVSIKDFKNYKISNYGRIESLKKNRILEGRFAKGSYSTRLINNDGDSKDRVISKLVAEHFIGNPKKYQYVINIDGNKENNKYNNLRWSSQKVKFGGKKYVNKKGEKWETVKHDPNYEVSNIGNVRNIVKDILLTPQPTNGYLKVKLSKEKKHYFIHRLVAEAFIPNTENKLTVDHIDRIRTNNNVNNLRWATSKEQGNNRNSRTQPCISNVRKIWRIDGSKRKLFDNINSIVEFISRSKLSEGSKSNIRNNIKNCLTGKNKTSYKYKWEYEEIKDLDGENWKNIKGKKYPNVNNYKISNMEE